MQGVLKFKRKFWRQRVKMYVQKAKYGGMYWIELAKDRVRWRGLVNAVMKLRVP
jgi:hypothetical protein